MLPAHVRQTARAASEAVSVLLGCAAAGLALAVALTARRPEEIWRWAGEVLGLAFPAIGITLCLAAVLCWLKLLRRPGSRAWLQGGLQAAGGLTTLALTFTLLGISLGIGALAGREITPDTVQGLVQELTVQFRLAFLSTVFGLPAATLLRALLLVTATWQADGARRGDAS
jgi:hypothetical protein